MSVAAELGRLDYVDLFLTTGTAYVLHTDPAARDGAMEALKPGR